MPFSGAWCKVWIYFGFVFAWTKGARPRFDTSTDMGLVLVPADAEVDSVIFRLRATDQDADFPLVFEITATITPVVRIDNLPCTLYNKVCQANVILTKRLVPGRLHDFAVRVRDTKGDSNSMQATISVTNATTPRDKIFPHIPSLVMVPEDAKPGKELDYLQVRANSWSGKPVYIELWQPKELFTIRQRQTPTHTRGVITLIGELDFETQSVYTLTMYATDPYTEPGKDTRNIAGLNVVVIVTDVQDVPPIFTLAPPLTRINNSVQPGDIVLRVHAEDGDKGVPREVVYGLVSEGNPFTPFFNISETSGEVTLARPLEELTQITHVGAPVVLTVVAEELRRSRDEPPAQATVVDVGFLLGEPGNTPPYFESDNYIATIDENLDPGTVINFSDQYTTRVKDEDIGKAGVFALKLENNNGTFEINPTVAERTADFIVIVRDNTLIDYELYKALTFKIVAQEVGPATNLSTSVPVTILLRDVNDNPPVFDQKMYEVTLSENVTVGSRVIQVHAIDIDTGFYGDVRYTGISGEGNKAFVIDPDSGLITVAMGSSLDREVAARLELSVEARDENGTGNIGTVPLIVNLLDVNDNPPIFDRGIYEFMLNADLTNFTSPAFIKAIDADAEPPNNIIRYEIIHGNYENKFYLNETNGELILRSPLTKIRRKKQSAYNTFVKKGGKTLVNSENNRPGTILTSDSDLIETISTEKNQNETIVDEAVAISGRQKRDRENALYTLTARAYDLGIPHLFSVTEIRVISGTAMEARIMMFVVPGEQPNSTKTAETLATITGGRVTVLETRPYIQQNNTGSTTVHGGGKKSIIVARVEQTEPGTPLVDVEKIRETLAANGVGIINGTDTITTMNTPEPITPVNGNTHGNNGQTTVVNNTVTDVHNEEVTVYKAENKLLLWLLIILGLLMLLAIIILITCCICPGCPFYMAPRKRRVHSSETLVVRSDGRPKRHFHRQPAAATEVSWNGRKQAWSADPTRRNWQFNKRNVKNCSLPGDVAYISGPPNDVQMNHEARRLGDAGSYDHSRKLRMDEQDRMYMEEMEGPKQRGYGMPEIDSLQRHEIERESDTQRQAYRQRSGPRYMEPPMGDEAVREQHFYREGNAEVLRLVTRGEIDDTSASHHHHRHHGPTTLIVDGKDIILQRFIEDQTVRPDLSMQDMEAARMMESHQRSKDMYQQQPAEIILIPDRLELGHRQHIEEIGPTVQRLVIDHGDYESQKTEKGSQIGESLRQEKQEGLSTEAIGAERPSVTKEQTVKQYSLTDLELARQKALLARLLLKRDNRHLDGGLLDSASYLETQSLPGQVAIATQTDRTAATQTDRHVRSRSDNDESDEDSRHRKKLKSRKKYGEGDWKRARTLWMKSPIDDKGSPCFDKRLSILQRKTREVKEDRKISLEPDVLREISDSLNGSSYKAEEDKSRYRKSEQSSVSYKILNETENDSSSSMELSKKKQTTGQKSCEDLSDDQKMNGTESLSSPDIKVKHDKKQEKSPMKEAKQSAKKSEGSIKPSFRILEKEFTMLTKKFSKLGEKKFQESTGSDSTSQEKSEPKKESSQKTSKKADVATLQRQASESTSKPDQKAKQKKETAIAKTKQKLRYQQSNIMSTGSSEFDELFEKNKKQVKTRQETVKQKQAVGGQKVKRQVHGRQELKKQVAESRDEDVEKRMKETKVEKAGKSVVRGPKLAASRKDRGLEESSTSDHIDVKRDKINVFEKKGDMDSSGAELKGASKSIVDKAIHRFSDDFVEQTKVESMKHQGSCMEKEETKKIFGEKDLSPKKRVLMKNGAVTAKQSAEKWIRKEEEMMKRVMEEAKSFGSQKSTKVLTVSDGRETKEKLEEAAGEENVIGKGMVDKFELVEMTQSPRRRMRGVKEAKIMREEAKRFEDQGSMEMSAAGDVREAKEKLKEAVIVAEVVEKGVKLFSKDESLEKEYSPQRGMKKEEETKRLMEEARSFKGDESMKLHTDSDILEAKEKLKEAAIVVDIIDKGMAPVEAESLEKPSEGEKEKLIDVANLVEVSSKDKVADERASRMRESKGIIIPVVTDTSKQEHESKDDPSEGTMVLIDESIVPKREDETLNLNTVGEKRDVEEILKDFGSIDEGLEVSKDGGKKDVQDVSPKKMEIEIQSDDRLVFKTQEGAEETRAEVGEKKENGEKKESVEKTESREKRESGEKKESGTRSKVESADREKKSVTDNVSPLHDVTEIQKELMKSEAVEKHTTEGSGGNGEIERKDAVETAKEDFEMRGEALDKDQVIGKEKKEEEISKIGEDDQLKESVLDQGQISEDERKDHKGEERYVDSRFPKKEIKMKEEKMDGKEPKIDEKETKIDEKKAKTDEKEAKTDEKETKIDEKRAKSDEKETKIDGKKAQIDEKEAKIDEKETKIDEKEAKIDDIGTKIEEKAAESATEMGDVHLMGKEIVLSDKEKEPFEVTQSQDSGASDKESKSEVTKKSDGEEKDFVTQTNIEDDAMKQKGEESILSDQQTQISPSKNQTVEEGSAFLGKTAASDGKEEAALEMVRIDEQKFSEKEEITSDEDKQKYLKEEKMDDEPKDASDAQDGIVPSVKPEIGDKDKPCDMQAFVDDRSSETGKDIASVSRTKDQEMIISEEKSDLPKDPDEQGEDTTLRTPDVKKESTKIRDSSSKSHTEEQSVDEDSVPIERPAEGEETLEKETRLEPEETQKSKDQASKMKSTFLEVAETVNLLDSKLASVKLVDREAKSVTDKPPVYSVSKIAEERDRISSDSKLDDHTDVPLTSVGKIDKPFHSDVLKCFKQAEEDQKDLEEKKEKGETNEFHEDGNKEEVDRSMDAIKKELTNDSTADSDPTDLEKPGESRETMEIPLELISDEVASPEDEKPEDQRPGDKVNKEKSEEQRPDEKVYKEKPEEKRPGEEVDKEKPEDQRPGEKVDKEKLEGKRPGEKVDKEKPEDKRPEDKVEEEKPEDQRPGEKVDKEKPEDKKLGEKVDKEKPEDKKPGEKVDKEKLEGKRPGEKVDKEKPEDKRPEDKVEEEKPEDQRPGEKVDKEKPEDKKLGEKVDKEKPEDKKPGEKVDKEKPENKKPGEKVDKEKPEDKKPGEKVDKEKPEHKGPGGNVDKERPEDKVDKEKPEDKVDKEKPEDQRPGDNVDKEMSEDQRPGEKMDKEKPEEQRLGDKVDKEKPGDQRPGEKMDKEKPEEQRPGDKVDKERPEDQRPGDQMQTRSPETKKAQVTMLDGPPENEDKELVEASEPSEKKVEHEKFPRASNSESQITEVHTSPEKTSQKKLTAEAPIGPNEQLKSDFTDRSFIVVDESFEPFLDHERKMQRGDIKAEEADEERRELDNERELEEQETYIGDEEYTDVSVPLFTEIMQQSDDLDESDSSSDVSRKTTLNTRPYQTPRHRSRQSPERETVESMEVSDPRTLEDEEDTFLTIELVRDDDLKPVARTETTKDEDTDEPAISLCTQITAKLLDIRFDKEDSEARQSERSMSASEVDEESSSGARTVKDKAPPIKQIDSVPVVKHVKPDTLKPEKKTKGVEKRRLPVQRKKKSSSEESSEEKALHLHEQTLHARHRPRRKFDTDQLKRTIQSKKDEEQHQKQPAPRSRERKSSTSAEKHTTSSKIGEIDTSKTQPKYMAWYKKNREEMERRRAELRASDDESQLPRWLRRSMRSQKMSKDDKKKEQTAGESSKSKRKVKPLVNVESEQLKAIVRQGRKLRKAEGGKNEDPPVQIFATSPPAVTLSEPKHHLVQHSEYKYEKLPAPFYLHPPPAPHPSPQLSPEHFEAEPSLEHGHVDEPFDSGIAIPLQGGARLRHQQLLEKKSVFDIAYSEAAPSQLRADSTTPPS